MVIMSESPQKTKLSLSIASKKSKKKSSVVKQPDVREAFAADPTPPVENDVDDGRPKEPLVIPAVPNKFGISASKKESTNLSTADKEALSALQAQAESDASKGNNTLSSKDLVIQASKDTFQRETQQFRADLETLPDELDSQEYARRVPIADFGAAMLRGMGWKDPEPDKKKKADSDEVMPRPHRLGLGAVPKMEEMPTSSHRRLRPDQLKQRARLEEQQKEYAAERERQIALDKQRTLQNGSLVSLSDGSRAKIMQLVGVPGLNMVKVWKENEGQESVVKRGEIGELLSRDELEERPYQHPKLPKVADAEDKDREDAKKERKDKRRREDESQDSSRERGSKRSREESSASPKMVWVIPNIRVRIVTEKLGRKNFKEKGIVVDVTSKGVTLKLDKGGTVLDRVPENYLETALPKPGGKVIVLAGRNKYSKGKLLERNSKTAKGVVQIFEDMNVLTLSLDDLAEFVGSLDDDLDE